MPGLKELVVGGESFKESDLGYLVYLEGLGKLTDSETLGALVNLTELRLKEIEVGDLSYISNLKKLKKIELKEVTLPNVAFLKDLRHLTHFESDSCAEDESGIAVLGELQKCLQQIGVDASGFSGLKAISGCNITGITIFQATSEEQANSVVAEFKKYFNLQSYGWQVTW